MPTLVWVFLRIKAFFSACGEPHEILMFIPCNWVSSFSNSQMRETKFVPTVSSCQMSTCCEAVALGSIAQKGALYLCRYLGKDLWSHIELVDFLVVQSCG